MPTSASDLLTKLERVAIAARDAAEAGARVAVEELAVHRHDPHPCMAPRQRQLRNQLRARARQLGDNQDKYSRLTIDHFVHECAYEQWHRMLFTPLLGRERAVDRAGKRRGRQPGRSRGTGKKEPERPKAEYSLFRDRDEKTVDFADGRKFGGNRWSACR